MFVLYFSQKRRSAVGAPNRVCSITVIHASSPPIPISPFPYKSPSHESLLESKKPLRAPLPIQAPPLSPQAAVPHPAPSYKYPIMATVVQHAPLSPPTSTSSSSPITMNSRKFALAQVHSDVCLVQGESLAHPPIPIPLSSLLPSSDALPFFPSSSLPFLSLCLPVSRIRARVLQQSKSVCSSLAHETCLSALAAVEAQIYAHEFITIFRYSHPAVLHPSDIRILEWLDEQSVLDEADKGTVFLARDVMERLRRLTDRRWSIGPTSRPPPRTTRVRGGRRMS